jgi:hypothetical protein
MESKMTDFMYIGFTVTGPNEEITRFKEAVRGQEDGEHVIIDFSRLIPIPQEITDPFTPEIHMDDHQVSYSPPWCERNWGASSNALSSVVLEDDDGIFSLQFAATGFPYHVIEKMVASFPELIFEGSASEDIQQFDMTFEGHNGRFTWQGRDYTEAFGKKIEHQ